MGVCDTGKCPVPVSVGLFLEKVLSFSASRQTQLPVIYAVFGCSVERGSTVVIFLVLCFEYISIVDYYMGEARTNLSCTNINFLPGLRLDEIGISDSVHSQLFEDGSFIPHASIFTLNLVKTPQKPLMQQSSNWKTHLTYLHRETLRLHNSL